MFCSSPHLCSLERESLSRVGDENLVHLFLCDALLPHHLGHGVLQDVGEAVTAELLLREVNWIRFKIPRCGLLSLPLPAKKVQVMELFVLFIVFIVLLLLLN